MSLTTEDEKKLFEALGPARALSSAAEQGFAAAADDPYGHAFDERDRKAVEATVKEISGRVHAEVRRAREAGTTRVRLYQYPVSGIHGAERREVKIRRAACERIMAAANASKDLLAWTEEEFDGVIVARILLMLDFSRIHARSLAAGIVFAGDPR